jgi:hypothetical protein
LENLLVVPGRGRPRRQVVHRPVDRTAADQHIAPPLEWERAPWVGGERNQRALASVEAQVRLRGRIHVERRANAGGTMSVPSIQDRYSRLQKTSKFSSNT